jgi:hypothetical protein
VTLEAAAKGMHGVEFSTERVRRPTNSSCSQQLPQVCSVCTHIVVGALLCALFWHGFVLTCQYKPKSASFLTVEGSPGPTKEAEEKGCSIAPMERREKGLRREGVE